MRTLCIHLPFRCQFWLDRRWVLLLLSVYLRSPFRSASFTMSVFRLAVSLEGERLALDGQAYTFAEYVHWYGEDSLRCWQESAPVLQSTAMPARWVNNPRASPASHPTRATVAAASSASAADRSCGVAVQQQQQHLEPQQQQRQQQKQQRQQQEHQSLAAPAHPKPSRDTPP